MEKILLTFISLKGNNSIMKLEQTSDVHLLETGCDDNRLSS